MPRVHLMPPQLKKESLIIYKQRRTFVSSVRLPSIPSCFKGQDPQSQNPDATQYYPFRSVDTLGISLHEQFPINVFLGALQDAGGQ